jgi:hypothetical protein
LLFIGEVPIEKRCTVIELKEGERILGVKGDSILPDSIAANLQFVIGRLE